MMAVPGFPVSRFEIAEYIGDLLNVGSAPRAVLLAAAQRRGARAGLVLVLRQLPDRIYRDLHDLWQELPDIPDVYDPLEEFLK
jgi:hypothetical protein